MTLLQTQIWDSQSLDFNDPIFWKIWDEANCKFNQSHPMLDSRFLRSCCHYFSSDHSIAAVTCRIDQSIRAIMLIDVGAFGVQKLFTPSQLQLAPMIISPELEIDIRALFTALPATCCRLDIYNADPLFKKFIAGPSILMDTDLYGVTMSIDAERNFADYWAARPAGLRQNIRRYLKRAETEGLTVSLCFYHETNEILDVLGRYGELESKGWKGDAGTAVHVDNDQGRFYADVVAQFAERDESFAFELYFDEELVASRICIAAGGMAIMLKTTYNEAYSRYSPGRILLHLCLEKLFSMEEIRSVEFYTNASKDQLQWCDATREIRSISLYRNKVTRIGMQTLRIIRGGSYKNLRYSLEKYDKFDAIPKDVVNVWNENCIDPIFQSFDWFENLYRHVNKDIGNLNILVLRNSAGECQAIMPTVISRTEHGVRDIKALSNYYSPSFAIVTNASSLSEDEAIRRIVTALCAQRDWDRIRLSPLHRNSNIDEFHNAARENGRATFLSPVTANWSERIDDIGDYLANRPSRLRSILKRKLAKLGRESKSEFVIASNGDIIDQLLIDYNEVYLQSWKVSEPYPGFIPDLVRIAARNGSLRFGVLYISDRPAAAQIWFVKDCTASIYKLAYSDRFSEYSSGSLLTMRMLEHVVQNDGVTMVDYLTGDDAFKKDWMSIRKPMFDVTIANTRTLKGIIFAAYNSAAELAKRCRN